TRGGPRTAARRSLPPTPGRAEAARDEHTVRGLELGLRLFERHPLRVEPAHAHRAAVVDARMLERLVHREVGVLPLDVLGDERNLDLAGAGRPDALGQLEPFAELGLALGQPELLADQPVEPFR